VGQGVLAGGAGGTIALVTIAEAAVIQLRNLCDLLECILWALDASVRAVDSNQQVAIFELSWGNDRYSRVTTPAIFGRTASREWVIGLKTNLDIKFEQDIVWILDWLDGVFSTAASLTLISSAPKMISREIAQMKLEDQTLSSHLAVDILTVQLRVPRESQPYEDGIGCWRNKIRGGVVVREAIDLHIESPERQFRDSLILTAGALWQLFRQALEPLQDCGCTFSTKAGEYLTCVEKIGSWFIWHYSMSSEELCHGQYCSRRVNVRTAGIRRNSPCILGWPAHTRESPISPIANKLAISQKFSQKRAFSLTLKNIQAQFTPGWSGPPVGVQASVGVSWSMKRYEIERRISFDPVYEMALTRQSVILVYCEERKVHLALHGADLIELLCVQRLRDVLCPVNQIMGDETAHCFRHPSAIQRIPTWRESNFPTGDGELMPGEVLLRDASHTVCELLDKAKKYRKGPLYWPLQDLLNAGKCCGLKVPAAVSRKSWYLLSKAYPVVIVAVGRIDSKLLYDKSDDVQLYVPKSKLIARLMRRLHCAERKAQNPIGGLVASNNLICALLAQAAMVYPATLIKLKQELPVFPQPTFSISRSINSQHTEGQGVSCENCKVPTSMSVRGICCIHYFN